ncbi:WcaF family extracellular polysaccharide biosynthesis acetyltransferase [Rubritalea profundi]|uniref:Putative colanic acid biosynthesis acetyltransferase n=1 Tax=Rubritalea profundi TaxID=1658618 RepID=A0A2S7U1J7_9BACT|nr:WcaF family extracellular polysaccharide biosynthesis acetyltransferase [Rubritalea profundi]PQJ28053.1 putative colanic acid biosynthesis acetyltransferase [Rubritalea profundi]
MDVLRNRKIKKWSKSELLVRCFWFMLSPLFRLSPRLCWGWRRSMLRLFGASVGKHVRIHPSAKIFIPWNLNIGDWCAVGNDAVIYNLGSIYIGDKVIISQRAHLCGGSHDFRDPAMTLIKAPITIEDKVWICADSFVGPGVVVGEGAVLAARGVAVKNLKPWSVYGGNPVKLISTREQIRD